MSEIEQKAMALINEVANKFCREMGDARFNDVCAALYLSIEQHEAFRQEVSDAVEEFYGNFHNALGEPLSQFIIVDPDPLVEAWIEATGNTVGMEPLNAAIERRGGKIVWEQGE